MAKSKKTSNDNWLRDYEAERARARTEATANLSSACQILARLGVETVSVAYNGQGDEGCIEEITFAPEPPAGLPDGLEEMIDDAVTELLPGGWEINEGSFGTLEIDVKSAKASHSHSWRMENVEEKEIDLDS